jgi:hypothetical protein
VAAQYHADGVSSLIELYRVHELADEIETATASLVELFRPDRLGHGVRIEACTLIGDRDPDGIGHQLGPHVHPLGPVFTVTLYDGIAERLGQHDPEAEARGLSGLMARETVAGDELDCFLDAVYVTGKAECDQRCRAAGIRRQAPADADAKRRSHPIELEGGQGLLGRLGDGEERVQLGQLEEGAKIVVETREPQLAAGLPDPLGNGHESTEPG